jgi:uncharacterized protein (TIGR02996 family)
MTTADEQAFLSAILAQPDDDTPRLVFADWLDERGGADDRARAALIRAQCRLEHVPPGRERTRLAAHARRILKTHARRWTAALDAAKLGSDWTFRRGFLDGGSMSATAFVRRGEELFRLAPTVRAMRFPNASNETAALAASPLVARLVSADLARMCSCGRCPIGRELRDLFKSEYVTNLRHLNVSHDRIYLEETQALARSKVLSNLTDLDLSGNPLGTVWTDGIEALVRAKHLKKLTRLNLSATDLQNDRVKVLAGARSFPAVTRLDLSNNDIRAGGVVALAESEWLERLRSLNLAGNGIGTGGAAALANLPDGAPLEELDVRNNELSEKAVARLKARFGKKVKL